MIEMSAQKIATHHTKFMEKKIEIMSWTQSGGPSLIIASEYLNLLEITYYDSAKRKFMCLNVRVILDDA